VATAKQARRFRRGCFATLSGFRTVPTHSRHIGDTDVRMLGLVGALRSGLRAFVREDSGQDVIEYGLLSAFFGIVAIAAWISIQDNLRAAYISYDSGTQNIWESPNPGGS
jgi:Flp pilus assembly pilin Flp